MKRVIFLTGFLTFFIYSCYKEVIYDENPLLFNPKELVFESIQASNNTVFPNGEVLLTAIASGDSLVFEWYSDLGEVISAGNTAIFTTNSIGENEISCIVYDMHGKSASKTKMIICTSELFFNSLWANDTIIPKNYQTIITADASGDQIEYEWSSNGGTLIPDESNATFQAAESGVYEISSKVIDVNDNELLRSIAITVTDGFVYKSLQAEKYNIKPGETVYVEAKVLDTSDETLTYTWRTEPSANILGSGSKVIFTICHADVFEVSCSVEDKSGNSESKTIIIYVED
jgi:hypothetical protein